MLVTFRAHVKGNNVSFGDRLREERTRLNLTQEDCAHRGGVHRRAQIRYEQSDQTPGGTYLAAIAAAGVDVHYVLTGQRAGAGLAPDEAQLLDGYRAAPVVLRAGARRLLAVAEVPAEPPAPANPPPAPPAPPAPHLPPAPRVHVGGSVSGGVVGGDGSITVTASTASRQRPRRTTPRKKKGPPE